MDLIQEKFKIRLGSVNIGMPKEVTLFNVKGVCQDKVREEVEWSIRNCTWNIMNIVDEGMRYEWRIKLTP